ncbi:MAG: hypothetical protein RRB13_01125 [bacterium]|nr:hypothetical protein [bacterium]
MNRVSFSPQFYADCEVLKALAPSVYNRVKENLGLLRNAEPGTIDGVTWDQEAEVYTWVFEPADTGSPFCVEADFVVEGHEIYLTRLESFELPL